MTIREAIKKSGTYNLLAPGSTKEAEKQLHDNETVLFAINSNISVLPVSTSLEIDIFKIKDKLNGVFVITDRRVFFCSSILCNKQTKEINLCDITSIDDKTNVLGMSKIRISGLTEMFVIDVNKKTLLTLKNSLHSAQNLISQNSTTKKDNAEYIDELERLAQLLKNNIITQEEFEAKKKQLLEL